MCPEVREPKPGACPSCGMALEPEVPARDHAHRIHLSDASRDRALRAWIVPDLRHGSRTAHGYRGAGRESRTCATCRVRFWIGVVLTVPLLAIAMGSMIWPHELMPVLQGPRLPWLEFVLATPVVLWCGLPFFQRFWTSLVNRSPNMFTLIGLGTGVAYLYSVVATIAPRFFPNRFAAWADIPTSTLKPPPRSQRSSCSGR